MNKKDRHIAIRERARKAIGDLYHNATTSYPSCQNDYEAELFDQCFRDYASAELDYIQSGGAYCDIQSTANGYIRKKHANQNTGAMAARLYAKRALIDRAKYAPWESISKFGKLYTYGRGGRTLAPENLIRSRGPRFSINDEYFDKRPIEVMVDGIRIIESFNKFVREWNRYIPSWWQEEKDANDYQADIDTHDGKRAVMRKMWV